MLILLAILLFLPVREAKLAGAAKHNLRKYHSQDYSRDNITLLYGTTNLMQDVKNVYRKEFDAALHGNMAFI